MTTTALLPPLRIGSLTIDTPVVLAPMAGVTNRAFRRLCREHGAGLYVAEMVTSRALVERTPESLRIIAHDADETPRSVQVYGVDPATVAAAVRVIAEEDRADHIDLNFGCPVPKVTRKGGGAALPWKRDLFTAIVTAAVGAAAPSGVPVTIKMRKGIDDDHLTYLEAGRIAQDVGVAAVALHARTAAEYYSGTADWSAITRLKEHLDVPVLGNGDIWSAEDAIAMVEQTGCDGVVVGRGCQGRPWLFADLSAAFRGAPERVRPGLGEVAATIRRHAELMVADLGEVRGRASCASTWPGTSRATWWAASWEPARAGRDARGLADRLAELDLDQPRPRRARRGAARQGGQPQASGTARALAGQPGAPLRVPTRLAEAVPSVSGG